MTKLVNRAKMTTATTGTGTISLSGAVDGYQTFADAGVSNSDVVRYVIEDGDAWEIGLGTYTASGTTLSRTLDESSTGSLLNLSGEAIVYVTAAAEDIVTTSGDSTVTGTITASRLAVSASAATLDIKSTSNIYSRINFGDAADGDIGQIYYDHPNNAMKFITNNVEQMAISNSGNVTVNGTVDGRDIAADGSKLDGIEAGADVTDTTNVTAAGALMDSEVTNLAAVKAFDPADYATAAQGSLADTAIQPGDNISSLTNDAGYTTNIGDITGVTAGAGLDGGGTSGTVTVSHADTSSQASVNNSGRTFIQDIALDTYGHVTGIVSATDADTFTGTVTSVATGGGLTGGTITTSGTISHADTSSQASVNNSGATVIQDVTLDTYGHVTGLGSTTLTASGVGALPTSGGTMTGTITFAAAQTFDGAGAFTWSGAKQLNDEHTGMSGAREFVILIDDLISIDSFTFFQLQIGDSGGIEGGGYDSYGFRYGNMSPTGSINTSAWYIGGAEDNPHTAAGVIFFHSPNGTFWTMKSYVASKSTTNWQQVNTGSKTLSAELDRVQLADWLFMPHQSGAWYVGWR